jgi:hypothetical protein
MSRDNAELFQARLRYFLKMSAQNKRYGHVHDTKGRDAALRRPRAMRHPP